MLVRYNPVGRQTSLIVLIFIIYLITTTCDGGGLCKKTHMLFLHFLGDPFDMSTTNTSNGLLIISGPATEELLLNK